MPSEIVTPKPATPTASEKVSGSVGSASSRLSPKVISTALSRSRSVVGDPGVVGVKPGTPSTSASTMSRVTSNRAAPVTRPKMLSPVRSPATFRTSAVSVIAEPPTLTGSKPNAPAFSSRSTAVVQSSAVAVAGSVALARLTSTTRLTTEAVTPGSDRVAPIPLAWSAIQRRVSDGSAGASVAIRTLPPVMATPKPDTPTASWMLVSAKVRRTALSRSPPGAGAKPPPSTSTSTTSRCTSKCALPLTSPAMSRLFRSPLTTSASPVRVRIWLATTRRSSAASPKSPSPSRSSAVVQFSACVVAGRVAVPRFTWMTTLPSEAPSSPPTLSEAPRPLACTASHRRVSSVEAGASAAMPTEPPVIDTPKPERPTVRLRVLRPKVSSVASSRSRVPSWSTSTSTVRMTSSKVAEPVTKPTTSTASWPTTRSSSPS